MAHHACPCPCRSRRSVLRDVRWAGRRRAGRGACWAWASIGWGGRLWLRGCRRGSTCRLVALSCQPENSAGTNQTVRLTTSKLSNARNGKVLVEPLHTRRLAGLCAARQVVREIDRLREALGVGRVVSHRGGPIKDTVLSGVLCKQASTRFSFT